MNNNLKIVLISLALLFVIVFSLKKCSTAKKVIIPNAAEVVDSLTTENKIISALLDESEKRRLKDSMSFVLEIERYKSLPIKERKIYITKYVSTPITYTDSTTCFDSLGIDSINIAFMERNLYKRQVQFLIEDTYRYNNILKNDSIMIDTLKKEIFYMKAIAVPEAFDKGNKEGRKKGFKNGVKTSLVAVFGVAVIRELIEK